MKNIKFYLSFILLLVLTITLVGCGKVTYISLGFDGAMSTTYTEGETISFDGKFYAFFSDGSKLDVTNDVVYNTNALTTSDTSVTFSYTQEEVTQSLTIDITVNEKVIEDLDKFNSDTFYQNIDGECVKYAYMELTYNSDGLLVNDKFYFCAGFIADDDVLYEMTDYSYSTDGLLITQIEYFLNFETLELDLDVKYEFEYDANGNRIKETDYSFDEGDLASRKLSHVYNYEYDSSNRLVVEEEIYYYNDEVSRITVYKYEYEGDNTEYSVCYEGSKETLTSEFVVKDRTEQEIVDGLIVTKKCYFFNGELADRIYTNTYENGLLTHQVTTQYSGIEYFISDELFYEYDEKGRITKEENTSYDAGDIGYAYRNITVYNDKEGFLRTDSYDFDKEDGAVDWEYLGYEIRVY